MSEFAELRQEMAKMEEKILTAISTLGKSVSDDLGAIRDVLEVISENHLAPEHQKQVKRTLAAVGRR